MKTATTTNIRIQVALSVLFLFLMLVPAANASASSSQELLQQAFERAFSDSNSFAGTRIFENLDYTPEQVKSIVEITPRPASLSVESCPDTNGSGHYSLLRVHASQIHYYKLVIDHGVLEFPGATLDEAALAEGRLVFRSLDAVNIETFVSSDDFLKVFQFFPTAHKLSNLKMKITPKQTVLSGKVKKGIFTVAFQVFGLPAIENPKKVRFNCRRLILNGLSLPRAAINTLFDSINPVFDAQRTWLNLELQSVENNDQGFIKSRLRLLKHAPPPTCNAPLQKLAIPDMHKNGSFMNGKNGLGSAPLASFGHRLPLDNVRPPDIM
ncbi:MAG: hypothetical protein HQM09_06390 [Candidatus Riflebacteria bacterium]|nr:hypothetical protein [Candidatus Riflebacteria bacterium]